MVTITDKRQVGAYVKEADPDTFDLVLNYLKHERLLAAMTGNA